VNHFEIEAPSARHLYKPLSEQADKLHPERHVPADAAPSGASFLGDEMQTINRPRLRRFKPINSAVDRFRLERAMVDSKLT
jgi:hypothetical protein